MNATGAPLSGIPIYYFHCEECGFLFAPEMQSWSTAEFSSKVYNAEYILVDPEYAEVRPKQNAALVEEWLGSIKRQIKHLDFGGGNGVFSQILLSHGWNSISYDPFYNQGASLPNDKYDLVTAFEVVEHAADVNQLMATLSGLLSETGVLLFTTSLSDDHLKRGNRLTWWYASPRNGHISIFSSGSLMQILARHGLQGLLSKTGVQIAFRSPPPWLDLLPHETVKTRIRDLLAVFPPALAAIRWTRNILSKNRK